MTTLAVRLHSLSHLPDARTDQVCVDHRIQRDLEEADPCFAPAVKPAISA